jgi:hypothetical protein
MPNPRDWLEALGLDVIRPENALVCTQCRVALTTDPRVVIEHCVNRHQRSSDRYHSLVEGLRTIPLVTVSKLQPRPNFSPEEPRLVTNSGFACASCPSITSSLQLTRRSAPCNDQRHHRYEKVLLQCWSVGGPRGRQWWIVTPKIDDEPVRISSALGQGSSVNTAPFLRDLCKAEIQHLQADANSMVDSATSDPLTEDPWIRRTAWSKTYSPATCPLL